MYIIFLCFLFVSMVAFSISYFVFIQFWQGNLNSFASSNNDQNVYLLIYVFYNFQLGYKKSIFSRSTPVHTAFYTSKHPTSSSEWLNTLQCWLSAQKYLHSATYTWGWYFLPCFYTESTFSTIIALQYISYGMSSLWKFVFIQSFHVVNLPRMCLPFPFIDSVVSFSNSSNSTLFQVFWE